jgi:hypothetical protein
MLRLLTALTLGLVMTALAGCSSIPGLSSGDAFTTRIQAAGPCVAAIIAGGLSAAADPELGFVTASDAAQSVAKIATGPALATALAACKTTIDLAGEDLQGAIAMIKNKATTAEPAPQRKARLAKLAPKAAGPEPIRVHVPL